MTLRVVLFANTDWYLYNFRRAFALDLRERGVQVILLSPPGPFGARLIQEHGLDWRAVPMDRRSLRPWRELGVVLHLWRLFARERPTLVHGFTMKAAVYGGLAARAAGVSARIHAIAGLGYVFTSGEGKARLLRQIVRGLGYIALRGRGARTIVQNAHDREVLALTGIVPAETIRLIPSSGVDLRRFAPVIRPTDRVPTVVLVARLLWDKGIREFVEMARALRAEGSQARFVLAGEPDEGNPVAVDRATINRWAAEGVITWRGHVEDVPAMLADADVMVLPSYYGEGLPRSLIEGAAAGLPRVTTDAPGCRDAVTDGEDGLIVRTRDVSALTDAVRRLLADPALRERLGVAARQRAVREFDEQSIFERTLAVYDEVLPPPLRVIGR